MWALLYKLDELMEYEYMNMGDELQLTTRLPSYERYPWQGRFFDGSWCFTAPLHLDGGRVFDGSWMFDGQQDFNLNSTSRKILFNSLEVDALHLAQELSIVDKHSVTFRFDGRRFDGSWLLGPNAHAQDATLETMAALTLADTEQAMDAAQIAPQIGSAEAYPFVHLRRFDGRWKFGRAAPLDGAWRLDGGRILDGVSTPDITPLVAVFDGARTFDGGRDFDVPMLDARFDSDEDADEQTSLSVTPTKLEDRVTVKGEECGLTVTVGRVFNGSWNFDAGNTSRMDGAWRLDGGRFFTVRRAARNHLDGAFDMNGSVRFERGGETFEQYRYTA